MSSPARQTRSVTADLTFAVTRPATVVLQVAAAGEAEGRVEELTAVTDGTQVPVSTVSAPVAGRQHVLESPVGRLVVRYRATVPADASAAGPPTTAERIEALRPSRYCPSDRVLGLAGRLFAGIRDPADTVRAICEHVHSSTAYTAGSSGPSTDGVDTLLSGRGVCRDYAHAVATLCRASTIPARVVAVYAPGLSPMDMHAVVEADVDGTWSVWDATRLAPRRSLVRIATGRDAADTAFATVVGGHADLQEMSVGAVTDGDLPTDQGRELARLGQG